MPIDHTITRRELLTRGALVAGGSAAFHFLMPRGVSAAMDLLQQATQAQDALTQRRLAMAATPIQSVPLTGGLQMLSGPGGNVIVSTGADGKLVVDTFVQPAWPKLKALLDGLGKTPIKAVVDTHWHFDHADNNGSFKEAGAVIVAHANTAKRLSERHELLGMVFEPSPLGRPSDRDVQGPAHAQNERGDRGTLLHSAGAHRHRHRHPVYEGERAASRRCVLRRHVSVLRRQSRAERSTA